MALSVGFLSNTDQSSAATTQLTGKNYKFQSSVHSPSFTWSSSEAGGTMKVAYNASCEHGRYEGGWWDIKLQKKVSGTWKTVANTADVGCTTYKQVGTLSFGKVSSSGTYRVLFKRLYNHDNGAAIGYVNIHSFSVYRG
jgi:hypothetical protein